MLLSKLISNVEVLKCNASYSEDITGISEKSFAVKKGYVFVCLEGGKCDGNNYIKEAIKNGASIIVSEKEITENIPFVKVKNARAALSQMWSNYYNNPGKSLKLIGITGTNGKTTTAYMIRAILEKAGKKVGVIGTVNYSVGDKVYPSELTTPDPETMQKLLFEMKESGCEYVVCEVSSHSLALDKMYGEKFEIGIFTNLSHDHLDFHHSMDEYFTAKAKLFTMCKKAVVNADDEYGKRLADMGICKDTVTCSAISNESDVCAKNIHGTVFEYLSNNKIFRISCPMIGTFNVYNALLAAACADMLDISQEDIADGISQMKAPKGRMEQIETGKGFSVIIDFAHTPAALENLLREVRKVTENNVICVFGCGGDRDKTKRSEMGIISEKLADFTVVTEDNSRSENPLEIIKDIVSEIKSNEKYSVVANREEAIKYALSIAKKGDTVVLAGKGHEEYVIDNSGKHSFSERETVEKELKNKVGEN